jgi:hypothetical protein
MPFNKNVMDESPYNNDGTLNGATFVSDRFGNDSSALYFDGKNAYVEVAHDASLNLNGSFSFVAWFKTDNPDLESYNEKSRMIFSKHCSHKDGGRREYHLCCNKLDSNGFIGAAVYTANDAEKQLYAKNVDSIYYDNQWHCVIVVYYKESGRAFVYLDCQKMSDEYIGSLDFETTGNRFLIGCYLIANSCVPGRGWFHGCIDDIRIYNRALTYSEISELGECPQECYKKPQQFKYLNIPTELGWALRIDVDSLRVIGRYYTTPTVHTYENSDPSRTTVDRRGNLWVANRKNHSVVKIGLVIGGTRCNNLGQNDPNGEYLKPPFEYLSEDISAFGNGDSLIRTSKGEKLAWDIKENPDDECILDYIEFDTNYMPSGIRHISIDRNNDVWVGAKPAVGTQCYVKIKNSATSYINSDYYTLGLGGYGGLIDRNNVLWSTEGANSHNVLKWDLNKLPTTVDITSIPLYGGYGIGIDANNNLWVAMYNSHGIAKIDKRGIVLDSNLNLGSNCASRGVAVNPLDNSVWVAHSSDPTNIATKLDTNNVIVRQIPNPLNPIADESIGVAIDYNFKIWIISKLGHLFRIDPYSESIDTILYFINDVEPSNNRGFYTYSDITGMIAAMSLAFFNSTDTLDFGTIYCPDKEDTLSLQICNSGNDTLRIFSAVIDNDLYSNFQLLDYSFPLELLSKEALEIPFRVHTDYFGNFLRTARIKFRTNGANSKDSIIYVNLKAQFEIKNILVTVNDFHTNIVDFDTIECPNTFDATQVIKIINLNDKSIVLSCPNKLKDFILSPPIGNNISLEPGETKVFLASFNQNITTDSSYSTEFKLINECDDTTSLVFRAVVVTPSITICCCQDITCPGATNSNYYIIQNNSSKEKKFWFPNDYQNKYFELNRDTLIIDPFHSQAVYVYFKGSMVDGIYYYRDTLIDDCGIYYPVELSFIVDKPKYKLLTKDTILVCPFDTVSTFEITLKNESLYRHGFRLELVDTSQNIKEYILVLNNYEKIDGKSEEDFHLKFKNYDYNDREAFDYQVNVYDDCNSFLKSFFIIYPRENITIISMDIIENKIINGLPLEYQDRYFHKNFTTPSTISNRPKCDSVILKVSSHVPIDESSFWQFVQWEFVPFFIAGNYRDTLIAFKTNSSNSIIYAYYTKMGITSVNINYYKKSNIIVFPNPANDYLFIQIGSDSEIASDIIIQNVFGTVVRSIASTELDAARKFMLNTYDFPSGLYFIRYNSSTISKFIVTH